MVDHDVASMLSEATARLKAGDLRGALECARAALEAAPGDAEAHNLLGTILARSDDLRGAVGAYRRSIELDPRLYKPHANLANLLGQEQRFSEAAEHLERAVALEPSAARLWVRLGQTLILAGRAGDGLRAYESALGLDDQLATRKLAARASLSAGVVDRVATFLPQTLLASANDPEAWALAALGIRPTAPALLGACVSALASGANLAPADVTVDVVRHAIEAELFAEAAALAARMRGSDAPYGEELAALEAVALELDGRLEEAWEVLEAGFSAAPTPQKAARLARLARRADLAGRALVRLRAARALFPDSGDLLASHGHLALAHGKLEEARSAFESARAIAPDLPSVVAGLALVRAEEGSLGEALDMLERAVRQDPTEPEYLSALLGIASDVATPERRLADARRFGSRFGVVRKLARPAARPDGSAGKLRVGYLALDARDPLVGAFLERVVPRHDRDAVDVFVYGSARLRDRPSPVPIVDIGPMSDQRAADRIARDALDVLVCLDDHAPLARLRILAYRPARLQLACIGPTSTLGLEQVDGRVTDWSVDPEGAEAHSVERLVRLRHPAWCYPEPADRDGASVRSADEQLRLGCLEPASRIDERSYAVWASVLKHLPGATLVLAAPEPRDLERLERQRAALAPGRVTFVRAPRSEGERLRAHAELDVVLDPYPRSVAAACAAAWAGRPVVTLEGQGGDARRVQALLVELGLGDLVSSSAASYAEDVARIVGDAERRAALAASLPERLRRSPLGDPLAFARSLEQTFRELLLSAPEPVPSVGGLSVRAVRTDVGTELVLPDSLGTVSTFVYLEQRRWFEDEVSFLRAAVGPDDLVVDVGANLGAYTIDLAARVGAAGRVVAFEPSPSTAAMLRASADRNRLTNVTVHQVALGERDGEATLVFGASPELHAIGSDGPGERVPIRSLKAFEAEIRGVRFLKLDAEGSEVAILRGAGELVRRESPLVMFELKHGNEMNTALIDAVRGLGFEVYQLCPGLGALVPFEPTGIDPYLLNLFGATPEMARELAERGLLVRRAPRDRAPAAATDDETAAWMSERPLFRSLGLDASPERAGLPLRLLVAASATRRSLLERYAALRAAAVEPAARSAGSPLATLTAARIALDLGQRGQAVALARRVAASAPETPLEPFACALSSYEAAPFRGWSALTTAQAIEVEVKRGAFSSFYLGAPLIDLLRRYIAAGGDDEEMDRRLGLCLARARRLS